MLFFHLLYYCDVNITENLENPLCFSTSIISSKFSKYKSVCETTKQFNLLSFAKFFKNSNTAPEFELSNVEITSSNVNVLIDGYRLLSNLNKLHKTTISTLVISPSLNVTGSNSLPKSLRCGSNLLSNSNPYGIFNYIKLSSISLFNKGK